MSPGLHWSDAEYTAWLARIPRPTLLETSLPVTQTEVQLLNEVLALAKSYGWLAYHTHDSRRSPEGFPDLVLTNGTSVLFVELKTATGKLTAAQARWLTLLEHAGQECAVWRPSDWPAIVTRLSKI